MDGIVKTCVLVMLLLCAQSLFATSVGTVLYAAKNVYAKHNGATRTLVRGSELNVGDVISTTASATAEIKYANGTLVTIGPDSLYRINAYEPLQQVVLKAELSKGRIASETTAGEKKREVLKTPLVTLAINGTKYKVFVPNNKKAYVQLLQGQISIGNQMLAPGESVVATGLSIRPAEYPAGGNILDPNVSRSSGHGSSATLSSNTSPKVKLKEAATSGAAETSFINSTVIVSQATSIGTAANSSIPPLIPIIALVPL